MVESIELARKIREGLIKSGFPLEMKIGALLDSYEWNNYIGEIYKDFETDKLREIDLTANKTLSGIAVHIQIACKKSTEKQLILYSPQTRPLNPLFVDFYFKAFPSLKRKSVKDTKINSSNLQAAFQNLDVFNKSLLSNKLIVSKGNNITEDNLKFLTDFDGLVKNSIIRGSDGYIDTGLRMIFLYVMIYDGYIFNLKRSSSEEFDLQQTEYGRLLYEPTIKFSGNEGPSMNNDYIKTANQFGKSFVIEIMTPEYFETYLKELPIKFSDINKSLITYWGNDWD